MILFVCDQVAGAEYLVPALLELKKKEIFWKIIASPVSAKVFHDYGMECQEVVAPNEEAARSFLAANSFSYAILSTSTESSLERSFALVLREKKIPYAQFIDQWVNYKNRFIYKGTVLFPDKIFTLDEVAKKEMVAAGIPAELIEILGQPYLEFQTIRNKKSILANASIGLNENKLLLISQPISQYYGNSLGFTEFDFLETACEAWKSLNGDCLRLTVAIHPLENEEKFFSLAAKYSSSISFHKGGNAGMPGLEIGSFSHVLGIFSLLMTQSVLLGVSTASFQPNAHGRDLCFLSQKGYIPKLVSLDQCVGFLSSSSNMPVPKQLGDAISGSIERLKNFILEVK